MNRDDSAGGFDGEMKRAIVSVHDRVFFVILPQAASRSNKASQPHNITAPKLSPKDLLQPSLQSSCRFFRGGRSRRFRLCSGLDSDLTRAEVVVTACSCGLCSSIAEGDDESVLEASGSVQASVIGAVLQKLGGSASSADASSFRGVNAGVRVYGNAVVSLTDCEILATAPNATGVFAYEDGVIVLEDCTVTVSGGGAGASGATAPGSL